MKAITNTALFQLVWLICVVGGSPVALIATLVYLSIHQHYLMNNKAEWRLIVLFGVLGCLIDGGLFKMGILLPDSGEPLDGIMPIWLLCLWFCVGTLFAHGLRFLQSRYFAAALAGFIGPAFSYFAGAKLTDINLAQPTFESLLLISIIWAILVPMGVWLSEKWQLYPSLPEQNEHEELT
ncbi:DUF2878 domain-containing protein [Marinomonas sp. C2222]|uniref:DUF2878 domain-containing protein n=1 Tax=Marinomonas sargassi TaxID=2984494 RepID=A0ABT2YUF4_9GAMM|nr:DUF2878 domain-containing protein [Marinomonas sargassi]MCV2403510.1 DUF2878 domain-containing protein [Marinomonas sargassi]